MRRLLVLAVMPTLLTVGIATTLAGPSPVEANGHGGTAGCPAPDLPHATYQAPNDTRNPGLAKLESVTRAATLAQGTAGTYALVDGAGADDAGTVASLAVSYSTPGLRVDGEAAVGVRPRHVADGPDRTYVANEGSCSVSVVALDQPDVPAVTIALPVAPGGLAFVPAQGDDETAQAGRLYVAEPAANQIAIFDTATNAPAGSIAAAGNPYELAVTGDAELLVLSAGHAGHGGSLSLLDIAATPPRTISSLPTDGATAMLESMGKVLVVENGGHVVSSFGREEDGRLTKLGSTPYDAEFNPSHPSFATSIVHVPMERGYGTGEVYLVTLDGASHVSFVFQDVGGGPMLCWEIDGIYNGIAAIGGGSPIVAQRDGSLVEIPGASLTSLIRQVTPAAPPALDYVLPGPLDVSWAPQDVARSAGIVVLIMLLLGVPTPLFNGTLSANRTLIERWLRRRRPRVLRSTTGGHPLPPVGRLLVALSHTWPGLVVYLGAAALLYAFLDAGFPGPDGLRIFATTAIAILTGTAVSQLPGELYVRRRYGEGGHVHVALWTLGLAAFCVATTRLTGVQPGYVYGIIGGFSFGVALSTEDHGAMAFRGMLVLIAVGFAAWLLRIPFQPGSGPLADGPGVAVNQLLVGLFVSAVEGAAIGLIPLRFLQGETLWRWSKGRWALLWLLGLFLFAHVILYPVSSYEPDPSAVGLATIVLTAAAYGAIALAFWWFFERRARRRRRKSRRAAAPASA